VTLGDVRVDGPRSSDDLALCNDEILASIPAKTHKYHHTDGSITGQAFIGVADDVWSGCCAIEMIAQASRYDLARLRW
jgi:hypothetical protein